MIQVQSIIDYLLNRRDFVPASDLAHALGVSTRTVARMVKQINGIPGERPVIESMRGKGYRLSDSYIAETDSFGDPSSGSFGANSVAPSYSHASANITRATPVERRDYVLKKLLMTAPQQFSVSRLWDEFYISESAVTMDIRRLKKVLTNYGCTIERVGDRIWVEGSEADIRRAICDLLSSTDVLAAGRFLQANQLVQQRDAEFVQDQLGHIEELTGTTISYPYSVNLFTHLYILIERFRSVGAAAYGKQYTDEERMELQLHPQLLRICKSIISNLDRYLNTKLPETEVYYLYQYLTSSRIDLALPPSDETSQKAREVTRYLIDIVCSDPLYADMNTNELFINLSKHMKPLLNRLQNKIRVNNNLLGQIILEYPVLFNTVKSATAQMASQFALGEIDDEEVGFITVYFANAYDTVRPKINIIIVCTTGLGSAQLLRGKIERRFSGFNIVETVASMELQRAMEKHPEVDLVVSTVGLGGEVRVPVLVVSAMLTIEDQERLERKADEIRSGKALRVLKGAREEFNERRCGL